MVFYMTKLVWWDKALGGWFRLKDEVIKVSQLGRAGLSRSFLIHERMKLTERLGEMSYRWICENGTNDPMQQRLAEQINKLNLRIVGIDEKMTGITNHLSQNLDASEGNDAKLSRKKISLRRKK